MKSTERHKLKENEFARSVAQARDMMTPARTTSPRVVVAAVVIIALRRRATRGGGSRRNTKASAALAAGSRDLRGAGDNARRAGAGQPDAGPAAGHLPDASRPSSKRRCPSCWRRRTSTRAADAGIAARYYAASALASLGRYAEAEQRFQEVVDKAGSKIYGRTAQLGVAEAQVAQGKFDTAITIYREMSCGHEGRRAAPTAC